MEVKYFFLLALYGFGSAFFGFFVACLLFAAKQKIPEFVDAREAALDRAFRDITTLDNKTYNMQCCGNCEGYDNCIVVNPAEVCEHWKPDCGLYLERRDMHDNNVNFVIRHQAMIKG